eukprot:4803287-Pleurochrysis_carterae.AAC.2
MRWRVSEIRRVGGRSREKSVEGEEGTNSARNGKSYGRNEQKWKGGDQESPPYPGEGFSSSFASP